MCFAYHLKKICTLLLDERQDVTLPKPGTGNTNLKKSAFTSNPWLTIKLDTINSYSRNFDTAIPFDSTPKSPVLENTMWQTKHSHIPSTLSYKFCQLSICYSMKIVTPQTCRRMNGEETSRMTENYFYSVECSKF